MPTFFPTYKESNISVLIGTVGGGNMSAGSHNLTTVGFTPLPGRSTADYFSAADVGRIVMILGAGTGATTLVTKIATFIDTQNVTLVDAAVVAVTSGISNTVVFRPIKMEEESITHEDTLTGNSQGKFTQLMLNGDYPVVSGQPFLFTSTDPNLGNGTYGAFFGGEVDTVNIINLPGTGSAKAECSCVSYETVLTRRVIQDKQYNSQTMKQIAQAIVSGMTAEFFGVTSPNGPTLGLFTVENLTYADKAMNDLMSACNDGDDKYFWRTDPWRNVVIAIQAATPGPFAVDETTGSDGNVHIELQNAITRDKFGNQAYIKADKGLGDVITETVVNSFLGTAIPSYRVSLTLHNKAGIAPSLTVNGVAKTVYTCPIDPRSDTTSFSVPSGFDWAWPTDSDYLFVPNGLPTGPGVPPGGTAIVSYRVATPTSSLYTFTDSINERSSVQGGSGIHDTVVQISNPVTRTELDAKTEALAKSLGIISNSLNLISVRSGLRTGQGIPVNLPSVSAVGTFLVESVNLASKSGWPVWTAKLTIGALVGDYKTAFIDALGLGSVGGGGVNGHGSSVPLTLSYVGAVGQVGSLFAAALVASGGVKPFVFSTHDGALPAGLSLDTSTGAILGTPTASGSFVFYGRVTDASTITQDITCSIAINDLPDGLVIPGSSITSLSGADDTADRWIDLTAGTRSLYAPQSVTIALSAYDQDITLWLNDGVKDIWIGWYTITNAMTFKIGMPGGNETIFAPLTNSTWRLKAALGRHNPNEATGSVFGLFTSATYSVAKMAKPGSGLITSFIVAGAGSGDFPYDKVGDDLGNHYYSIGPITIDASAAYAAKDVFDVVVTVQDIDTPGSPIGPEHIFTDFVPINGSVVIGPLIGPYGVVADPPRSGYISGVRFRVYTTNRLSQSSDGWQDTTNKSTLQATLNGGGDYVDVVVAVTGDIPTGSIPANRLRPNSVLGGLTLTDDGIKFASGEPNVGLMNGDFEDGTGIGAAAAIPHWQMYSAPRMGINGSVFRTGAQSLQVDTIGGFHSGARADPVTARPGDEIFVEAYIASSSVTTYPLYLWLAFYNAAGTFISDGNGGAGGAGSLGPHADPTAIGFNRVFSYGIAPAGASKVVATIEYRDSANDPGGGLYYVDSVRMKLQDAIGPGQQRDGFGGTKPLLGSGMAFDVGNAIVPHLGGGTVGVDGSGRLVVPPSSLGNANFGSGLEAYAIYTGEPTGGAYTIAPNVIIDIQFVPWKIKRKNGSGGWTAQVAPADIVTGTITALLGIIGPIISAGIIDTVSLVATTGTGSSAVDVMMNGTVDPYLGTVTPLTVQKHTSPSSNYRVVVLNDRIMIVNPSNIPVVQINGAGQIALLGPTTALLKLLFDSTNGLLYMYDASGTPRIQMDTLSSAGHIVVTGTGASITINGRVL